MTYAQRFDPYVDANGVLKNIPGIRDAAALEKLEAKLVFARHLELIDTPIDGLFDRAHICAIHKHLFQDIYAWAGELRTIDISKGGTLFCHAPLIAGQLDHLASELAGERHLQKLSAKKFSKRAAYFLGEMNIIHPFREGNGRAQRVWLAQLSAQAGYSLTWRDATQAEVVEASIVSAKTADSSLLAALIFKEITRKT